MFRNFFAKHGPDFENAPPFQDGEHDLKYFDLFNVYLKLYEVFILYLVQAAALFLDQYHLLMIVYS